MAKEIKCTMCEETIRLVAKARTREDLVNEILKIFPNCRMEYLDTLTIGGLIDQLDESIKYTR